MRYLLRRRCNLNVAKLWKIIGECGEITLIRRWMRWKNLNRLVAVKLHNFTVEFSCASTYFSGELWWIYVGSPLTLAVILHNFTAFHRKIMYEICGWKLTFHRLSYIFFQVFLNPGSHFIINRHPLLSIMTQKKRVLFSFAWN